jgi:hypothetical protein
MNTKIRMQELRKVFPSDADSADPSARIARLCVLYEDLRIELMAIAQKSIRVLDATDRRYTKNYFLRRSIGTLVEFAEGLRLLDESREFNGIKASFPSEIGERWNAAVVFFKDNKDFLQKIRNDIGGHFGEEAARFTISHVDANAIGKIEIRGKQIYLHFAGELAATAAARHLPGRDSQQKFSALMKKCVAGYKQATTCVHSIVAIYLWDKFG